jgi:predicted transcriptional regulator
MAYDLTKYSIDFNDVNLESLINLNKRQLVVQVIKFVLEKELITREELNSKNLNPTHNKTILVNSSEYNLFKDDKKSRYSVFTINDESLYVSNQWRKSTIDGFLEFAEEIGNDHYTITEISEEDEILDLAMIDSSLLNFPLNQILYGPPGTGKTYNVSSIATRIINSKNKSALISKKEKFGRICKSIRTTCNDSVYDKLNGNNIYRNFSKSMVVWGWFLDPKYDNQNTIIHEDLKDIEGFKRSGWSQRMRYLTEFGFIEGEWKSQLSGALGDDMTLSAKGLAIKNQIKDYIDQNLIDRESLKNWPRENGLPELLINAYVDEISKTCLYPSNVTAFKKTILCALNMCLNEDLFKQNRENRESTQDEINIIRQYFDVADGNSDYKWIGWIGENLVDLGIVKLSTREENERVFYELTTKGKELIDIIINNWQKTIPSMFGQFIDYETATNLGLIRFVTFHQSYSYEEFIEGIKPVITDNNQIAYAISSGIFKEISLSAQYDSDNNYVIIIDEINRGNISKIFGELITLIESSKRLFSDNNEQPKTVMLPYSKTLFGVPNNLYIIGTMNTADKSITNIDTALRRRFSFLEFPPLYNLDSIGNVNKNGFNIDLKQVLKTINDRIEYLSDKDHLIGHAFFIGINDWDSLCKTFRNNIIPLLQEYFYNDFEKLVKVLGDNDSWGKDESKNEKFIIKKKHNVVKLFGENEPFEEEYNDFNYKLNDNLINEEFSSLSEQFFIKGFNLR